MAEQALDFNKEIDLRILQMRLMYLKGFIAALSNISPTTHAFFAETIDNATRLADEKIPTLKEPK